MFHQVHFAHWSGVIALIAFVVSATVFLFFLIGALRTPRAKVEQEAARPLEGESTL
jgi:uncharacterized phage infection (PIP) family protein YhgE